MCFAQETYHIFGIDAAGDGHTPPWTYNYGDIYAGNDIMSEYTKFMGFLGDYYQITPGWATARTEWWNMLQRVGTGEPVEQAGATFVENANAAATAEA